MRTKSSIVAVIVLAIFPLSLFIWKKVDSSFYSRDTLVGPLAILYASTGVIAALVAIVLATKRRPVAVGFGVYAILHGSGFLYLSWRGGFTPGLFALLVGLSICVGLRAVIMMRNKHDTVA